MAVPWSDARAEYEGLKKEIDAAIQRVIQSGRFQHGEEVDAFEKEFAQFFDVGYAIGTGSCYAAMLVGLLACGVGPGDEVITVANTDIATTAAISHTGAAIVWVDIDERTYNIDPGKIEARITPRTKAILPVHMYGLPADMAPIMDIAQRRDLWVIEDAALSVGARYKGRRAGTIGHVGCFSFVYGKGLGAYGDAGMAVTDDPTLADKIRKLGMYSADTFKYEQAGQIRLLAGFNYTVEGHSSRLMPLHAAVLREKLNKLDGWTARRREIARRYGELFSDLEIILPYERDDVVHGYRNYTVRMKERERVRRELAERGIPTGAHYVPPLHLQPVYKGMDYGRAALPVTEKVAQELVTLPIYPEVTDEQVEEVANALRDCVPAQG